MSILTIDKFLPDEPPYSSEEIAGLFFKDADVFNPASWVTIINESETLKDEDWLGLKNSTISEDQQYLDTLKGYVAAPVIITETAPVRYQIFISDDGDKLNYLVNNNTQGIPKRNEILIFIEGDSDTFSKRIMHIKVGSEVTFNSAPFYLLIHPFTEITEKDLNELLKASTDKKEFENTFLLYVRIKAKVKEFAFSKVSQGLGKAIQLIDTNLKVKESQWNPGKEKNKMNFSIFHGMDIALEKVISYTSGIENVLNNRRLRRFDKVRIALSTVVVQLNKALEILSEINKFFIKVSDHLFALVVGVWNGLVDMISGLIFLIKLVFDGAKLIAKGTAKAAEFAGDGDYRATVEQLDNVLDKLKKINLLEVFRTIFKEGASLIGQIDFSQFVQKLKSGAKKAGKKAKEAFSLTSYEIAYYIGYVATFFIPVAWIAAVLGKFGKFGKLLGGALKWVDDMMARLVGVTIKGLQKAAKPLTEFLRIFAKKLAGGTRAMINGVTEIFHAAKRWLAGFLHNVLEDLLRLWKFGEDFIRVLRDSFGIVLARENDLAFASVSSNYAALYQNQVVMSGPKESIRLYMKKLENIYNTPRSKGGREAGVKKELANLLKRKKEFLKGYKDGFKHYEVRDLSIKQIRNIYGNTGAKLFNSVKNKVLKLIEEAPSNNWLNQRQLIAGFISKEFPDIIILRTNFPTKELNKLIHDLKIVRNNASADDIKVIYRKLYEKGHIDYPLHPNVENRIKWHFEQLRQGIDHPKSYKWNRTGGLPGLHAEVLAMSDLLWAIEKRTGKKVNEDIFESFIGYNKNLMSKNAMIRCGDCQMITHDIPFLEKILK